MERSKEAAEQRYNQLLGVAKQLVTVLEEQEVTQGEALVVFSLAKAVLHHQLVKLPQMTDNRMFVGNYLDWYPDKELGALIVQKDSEQ